MLAHPDNVRAISCRLRQSISRGVYPVDLHGGLTSNVTISDAYTRHQSVDVL